MNMAQPSRWRLALAELNTSNLVAYNAIINHFGKSTAWWKAVAMFGELDKNGDAYSCNSVINAFERGGEWKCACDLWTKMICSNLQPDVITYNSAISACAKAGKTMLALELLQVMERQRNSPNVISYSSAPWPGPPAIFLKLPPSERQE